MERIIEIRNLRKSYGDVRAVDDISFYVEKGKLFAFLGPNGAGKSTTIDMICTFLKPDSGEVMIDSMVLGRDDARIRASIGAVFQDGLLDGLLTVRENLKMRGAFYGLKGKALEEAVGRVAKSVRLEDFLDRQYGKLSGGQRRRADIARALIHTPKILFLDEPTTGLDPQTRKSVWEMVQELQRQTGMTILLTTHYMEEAAEADYVVVMDDGRIAARGTPSELKCRYASDSLKLVFSREEEGIQALEKRGIQYTRTADQVLIKIPDTLAALPIIEGVKPYLSGFEVTNGTMDDAFIGITGKEIRQ